jgi:cell division protein FtsZ
MSQEQQPGLLLLGVGGGGCRLAASVLAAYGGHMRAVGVDTDALSNRQASEGGLTCLLLGGARLAGHGTGGDAIKGRLAAQDDLQNLVPHLQGVRTVVLLACLGAGTGGGATTEIIKCLHGLGIATICFVTYPFAFEGDARRKAADRVMPMLEENADSMVVVALDELFSDCGGERLEESLSKAEAVIASAITLLWRLVTKPGFIQTDPERLHGMIVRGGNARLGSASAQGVNRASKVTASLCGSRLLRTGEALSKAGALLVGILAGSDLRLEELGEIMRKLKSLCPNDCHLEMGTVLDAHYDGRIEVVVLAFENWISTLSSETKKDAPPVQEPPVADSFPIHPGSAKKVRGKSSKLSFGTTGRGKFQNVEPTLFNGQDLDIPTFVRRGILLER